MFFKKPVLIFITVYFVLSIPAFFSLGYVIDWVAEASLLQRIIGYSLAGLTAHAPFKLIISLVISVIVSVLLTKKRR